MWFKNLLLYRVHGAPEIDHTALDEVLGDHAAVALGSADARRLGWTPPAGRAGNGQYVHDIQGHRLLSALRQERLLPAAVVREEVEERIADIEQAESRRVTRQEKTALKEEITEALLPQAFIRRQKIDLWWDSRGGLLGINAASRPRAEEVLDLLRETLGSLKVTPLSAQTLPIRAMTEWLGDPGSRPADMRLGDQVELKAKGDDGVLRARQVDLDGDDMQQLLESGRQASKLALGIDGRLNFVLTDELALKSLRFGDALIEEADHADDGDDALARLETDFILMAQALADDTARLLEWLGGEARTGDAA
ncbi:recombination-associated protein RdgC [Halomonas cibimaris]|uniref:Recombination-associated protein RdgC n=1 Tax=Halomonas cibimaris TaxID=657012 RepID=A0ABP7LV78_9GAMM